VGKEWFSSCLSFSLISAFLPSLTLALRIKTRVPQSCEKALPQQKTGKNTDFNLEKMRFVKYFARAPNHRFLHLDALL
jgi:hypothetical protein